MNQTNHARLICLILALVGLISATLVLGPLRITSAQSVAPSWSYTGSLNTARVGHTATLLPNGMVLVAGGYNSSGTVLDTAELYDAATGTWSYSGNLNGNRFGHTATLLANGRVLVAGGFIDANYDVTNRAELYDPATGTWSSTENVTVARGAHTATLLPNGKVLVAGGVNYLCGGIACFNSPLDSAELYDQTTGTWNITGNLKTTRAGHTATLLPNGKVVHSGGYTCPTGPGPCSVLNTVELYDAATGAWTYTGNLNAARAGHTATLLPNGKVLVAGNYLQCGDIGICEDPLEAELYDPTTRIWSNTDYPGIYDHTATLLPGGNVLLVAGTLGPFAELYDPATGTFNITANPNTERSAHTATLLLNGKVLVAGGFDSISFPNSAELYDPGVNPILNQIDDAQFFVRQQYLDFLNREPDTGGLAYWTNRITECGSDARCIHERRIGVSAAFFIELEFQDTGYYVYCFYKASFGRQPNYAEFNADRSKVVDGPSLEANKQAFADEWVQRTAFTQAYPITMSKTEFVNKLFDTAGLTASIYDSQRQQEIAGMDSGRSRALVLRDVIEIPDFKSPPDPNSSRYAEVKRVSQYNPAFVLMQYFGYLRRNIDQNGYDHWLDVLNNRAPNDYPAMVCAFLTSAEYQLRFGASVTRTNQDCGP